MSADGALALAVTGSNLTGDLPFSAALRRGHGAVHVAPAAPVPPGTRTDLAAMCAELCLAHGATPQQLDTVLVDVGPGSYTGLRVAITFVRFLVAFGGARAEAVDSLALLAHRGTANAAVRTNRVRALLDARRGRWHTALYGVEGERLRELEAPAAVEPAVVQQRLVDGDVLVVPAALRTVVAATASADVELVVATGLHAGELFHPGLPRCAASVDALEPRYLMGSYADG